MTAAATRRAIRWFLRASAIYPAALAVVHAGAIFSLSAIPGESFGERGHWFGFVSNLAHAPLFAILGFLVAAALVRVGPPAIAASGAAADSPAAESPGRLVFGWRRITLAVTISQAYAGFDEWHQSLVPGRSPDPRDLVTDLLGILLGVLVVNGAVRSLAVPLMARAIGAISVLACVSAWFASRA